MNPGKLLTFIKKNKYFFFLSIIFLAGVALFAALILVDQRIPGSDDTVFQTQILPYHNVIEWIVYRYQSWSGRIFSEGFVYVFSSAPLYFWKVVSVAIYALFCGMLFAYYKLFSKNQSQVKNYILLVTAFCLPFLTDKSVLAEGGLWVTGSMVYFWISALGLAAFYPIAYYVAHKQRPHWLITCIGIICAVVAASSQEQVGVILLGLSLAFLTYAIMTTTKNRQSKIPWYIVFFCATIGLSLAISVLAPGNSVRLKSELITWLPDFYTTPLLQRIEYSYRWFLEAFINHTGFLLVMSWGFMAALFAGKKNKNRLDYIFIFILTLASLFALSKGSAATSYWLNFYATWKPTLPNTLVSINLLPWGIILILTILAPLVLFRKQTIGYLLTLLYLAAVASTAILLYTPTMYASLWRSFFIPSVVLMIVVYILFDKVLHKYWQYRYVLTGLILSLALSHYLFQVARLVRDLHK